ncbi:MAG: hypothetical protein ACI4YB_00880 [Oscillospiraceae bacterium]
MKGKFKRAILSCLLAFGISVSLIGTDISMIASFAEETASKTTVISAEEFKNLTLEDCQRIVDGIDRTPNENGEVILDLTEEEMYAVITVSEYDKADIYEELSYERDESAYAEGSSDYLYNQLNTKEKEFYNNLKSLSQSIMDSSVNYSTDLVIAYYDPSISSEKANAVFTAFYYENPQYYFFPACYLVNSNTITSNGKCSFPFGIYKDFLSASTRASTNAQIASVTSTWKAGINQYSAPYDKEQYIADTLCDKIVYELNTYDQSIYGSMINNRCVCNGYAMAFTYLCNIAGLEAFGVPSPGHAWNMVKVENNWHCVDVTWMDGGSYPNHTWFNRSHEVFLENDTTTCHNIHSKYADNFTLPVTVDSEEHAVFLVSDGTNSVNLSERDIASFANDPTKDYLVKYTKSGGYCLQTDLSKIKAKSVTFLLTDSNESYYSFKNLHFNFNAVFYSSFYAYADLYADGITLNNTYSGFNGITEIKTLKLYDNSTIRLGKINGSAVSVDDLIFNCGSRNSYADIYADTTIGNITVQSGNVYLSVLDGVNARVTGDITASSKINLRYTKSGTTSTGSERVYNAAIPHDDVKMLTLDNTSIGTSVFKSDYAAFTSADWTDYYWVKYNVYKKGNDIVLSTADPLSSALSIKNSNILAYNGNTALKNGDKVSACTVLTFKVPDENYLDKRLTINGQKVDAVKDASDNAYYYQYEVPNDGAVITADLVYEMKINSQPADYTAVPGGIATFKVTASGEGLTYQWQYSCDNGKTWKNYSVTSASCSIIATPEGNNYLYRCIVTDENGTTIESDAAKVTVKAISEVTVEDVQKLDIKSLIRFVDLFDENADILTDAQIKAIELVLEYDYSL